MTKKTRLTILLVCVACFLVIAPALVLYSMGYRFDFEKMKVTETGGIYVRTFPSADQIIIDSKIKQKPGIFSNYVFVQSLLPKNHTVLVEKTGYYDYSKTLPVQEKQVTKLEDVLLIKKNIQFNLVTDETKDPFNVQDKFIIKNSNLYYSDSPENLKLTTLQKSTPVIKKIISFVLQNNNIMWLGADGFPYKSDFTTLPIAPTKITLTAIKITKTGSYKILLNDQNTFLIANGELLVLNNKTNNFNNFYNSVNDAKISPDGKNIIYYDNNNIYISPTSVLPVKTNTLYKSSEKITNCLWANSSNIIFTAGDKIIISEIDYRGNINNVTLPQTMTVSDPSAGSGQAKKIDIKKPQILFNQQENKLYILTGKNLISSEKIIP
ncbi:MAG: hypothetical protein NTY04_00995 [Candidatus Staskawiczbacteria bacterium]|nr:hypothetical protein [Candidatus Staskawiczbacteria bacterium]